MIAMSCGARDVPTAGLFTGLSGLRAVAYLLNMQGAHYDRLISQCDQYIEQHHARAGDAVTGSLDYDLIGGCAGARIARVLQGCLPEDELVSALTWILADDKRWCCRHPLRPTDPPENDIGLSHGICGPIAAIALTVPEPTSVLKHLVSSILARIVSSAVQRKNQMDWPPNLQLPRGSVSSPSWCYGMPGIAAALYWAAKWLRNDDVAAFALKSLKNRIAVPLNEWRMRGSGLCHGIMGNAMVYASVGLHSGDAQISGFAEVLVNHALLEVERSHYICWSPGNEGPYDAFGYLDGAAGVMLALLTLCGDCPSTWMRCHALEPLNAT